MWSPRYPAGWNSRAVWFFFKLPEIHRGHGKIQGEIQRGSRWSTLRWRTSKDPVHRATPERPQRPKMHGTRWVEHHWGTCQKPETIFLWTLKMVHRLVVTEISPVFRPTCTVRLTSFLACVTTRCCFAGLRTDLVKTLSTRETWHQTIAGVSARKIPRGIEVSKSQPVFFYSVQSFVKRPPLKSWNLHF